MDRGDCWRIAKHSECVNLVQICDLLRTGSWRPPSARPQLTQRQLLAWRGQPSQRRPRYGVFGSLVERILNVWVVGDHHKQATTCSLKFDELTALDNRDKRSLVWHECCRCAQVKASFSHTRTHTTNTHTFVLLQMEELLLQVKVKDESLETVKAQMSNQACVCVFVCVCVCVC